MPYLYQRPSQPEGKQLPENPFLGEKSEAKKKEKEPKVMKKKPHDAFRSLGKVKFKTKSVPFTPENYSRFKKKTGLYR